MIYLLYYNKSSLHTITNTNDDNSMCKDAKGYKLKS